ncbi:MAG: 2-amino-4-hydroxy-6-hydroxymethyldihydropteridine diphosphokinase [Taibaiella sp.]|nr:2-amino-4-hydroxy-6-hydroxymethyldihydropteridine diphosphokinase [Taibaiella sp.]
MSNVYLSLGSNQGDRELWLNKAIDLLGQETGEVLLLSHLYETSAWGIEDQPDFLNMCVQLRTTLNPFALLQSILDIETSLGRHRQVKWGPRIIDIDILFYDELLLQSQELTIPHLFMQERKFVLLPLAEIAPALVHLVFNRTIAELLAACADELEVRKLPV